MSDQTDGPGGPPPYAGGPTRPMPQWYPAVPRRPFRERTTPLWVALVAGLACLLVGLGIGLAIGHATADDDDRAPGRYHRFPGEGPGFGTRDGGRDGQRFGGRGFGTPGEPPATTQPPTPSQPPTPHASPSATG